MNRWIRRTLLGLAAGVALLLVTGGVVAMIPWTAVGALASGERLERMKASPRWQGDRFRDVMPRQEPKVVQATLQWLTGKSGKATPDAPLPVLERHGADFAHPPDSGLRITWLGHSTLLVEIDGQRVLLDPVWGERTSPFSWAGPRRFFPPPLPLDELPEIDAVVISHDHYDHLDYPTIVALNAREARFVVPLGVGAHLEHWGVPPERIEERDWWGEVEVGALRLVCAPARHFSGRSLTLADRDRTLWAGWALIGPQHRVFYSGDTAMFPGFAEIGERLGPFDVTMMESGAYNALWADVHMGPEQAVAAHQALRGELFIPVHWGLFDLALHGWTEPVERVLAAAAKVGVKVATPRPGESIEPALAVPNQRWWPDLPWQRAEEAPVVSSGLSGT